MFTDIAPPAKGDTGLDVKMSARMTRKGGSLTLSIPGFVFERIGAKPTDKFAIAVGRDEDAGQIRIIKDKAGSFTAKVLKGTCIFRLGVTVFSPAEAHAKTALEWDVSGTTTLLIDLPAWCRLDRLDELVAG